MFKGVTPVLAVVLLVAIAVGLVTTVYHGISSLTEEAQTGTGSTIEQQFDVMGADLKVDVFGNCKIYLRNTGTKDVPINVISFYADNKPVNTSPTTGTLKKDGVQEITFLNLAPKKYKVLVKIYGNTMDYGYMTCTGGLICGNTSESDWFVAGQPDCDQCNFDDDNDGDQPGDWSPYPGMADQCDSDCGIVAVTVQLANYENGVEVSCADGIDNDCDGAVDGADPDCGGAPVAFSCYINETGSCGSGETAVLALSAQENAHAELETEGNYNQLLCCSNVSSVQTTTGTGDCDTLGAGFTGLITLSEDTNAQVEKYNYTGADGFPHKKNVCVALIGGGSLKCKVDTKADCILGNYDKYLVSISGETNAHIGNDTAYSLVLCCKKAS